MTPVSIIPTPIINRDFPIIVVYAFLSAYLVLKKKNKKYYCILGITFLHILASAAAAVKITNKQKNKMPTMSKKNNSNHRIKSPPQKEISH